MALPKLNSPTYELKVPSTGNNISYRPYLVKEEKILMMAMESNDNEQMMRAVKDVIRSCTSDSVDVDTLAMFDIEYIFTQLRAKSVGETSTVSVKCSECGSSNDVDVNLDEVYVNVPESTVHTIPLTDTVGVSLKYPSVNAMVKAQASDTKSEIDRVFDLIVACIDSIYSDDEIFDAKEQSEKELKEFIESLNTQQFNQVRDFIESIPSAAINVEFMCMSCSKHNSFEVKGLGNFFG
jgi:DNA-directed RNA polymerase subunit RPC12/RpoP